MHDIWNPWHGCVKCSEGCDNCYMYFLDRTRGQRGDEIYRTKNGFDYPLRKKRGGGFRIQSGELLRVCMTSDFFSGGGGPVASGGLGHHLAAAGCKILSADEAAGARGGMSAG